MAQDAAEIHIIHRLEPKTVVKQILRLLIGLGLFLTAVGLMSAAFTAFAVNSTSLITWGNNGNGQLGRPSPVSNLSPGSVMNLGPGSGTIAIAGGTSHSLALKSNETVLAWGSNSSGQLGDGTTVSKLAPVQVSGLGPGSGVVEIAAANGHSLARKSDGTVLAWGSNANGQLGDGTTISKSTPTPVLLPPGSPVIAIAAGSSHSMALRSDGTVLAWGLNSSNQLGDGTNVQSTTPVQVSGLGNGSGVLAIAAGGSHSLARKSDGTVLAWGANSTGQLGDGTIVQKSTPTPVLMLGGILAISAGNSHSMALQSDGTVWAWGSNSSGQLGINSSIINQSDTAVQVSHPSGSGFLTGGAVIVAGSLSSHAIQMDGTVLSWGLNSSGQLGIGNTDLKILPVQVNGLGMGSGMVKAAAGNAHTLALKNDGSVVSWGSNSSGQLGKGTFDGSPLAIQNLNDVTAISAGAGGSHNLALKSDGSVVAWGFNLSGQLGDGTVIQKNAPVQVSSLTADVTAIAAGSSHSLAVKNGGVWAWGMNTNGQLGNGSTSMRTTPVQVTGMTSNVVSVAAGGSHSLALKSDGTVWAWGLNTNGQLGDGSTLQRTTPVQVSGFTSGIAVAAGTAFSLALKSDGTLWAWGLNTSGQLGDASNSQKTTPVQVKGVGGTGSLLDVAAIAAGSTHSLAVKTDGSVFSWGSNGSGQLGSGNTTSRNTPDVVINLSSGVVNVAGASSHSLALKSDGTIWSWGSNSSGQLGDGSLENRLTPVQSLVTSGQRIAAGNSHSLALTGSTDTTGPVVTATATGTLGNNNWYRSDVGVTWTITDPESAIASTTGCSPTTLTADTTGITLTCTALNAAGISGSGSITIRIDKTPPAVSVTRTPANANGWNNGSVLVQFSASDSMSGMSGSATADQTVASQGQNQTASASFSDNAGNVVTATIDGINIDTTPPTLQFGVPSPAPNGAGWNNTDVGVNFTTADNLSGVFSTSASNPLVLSADGTNVTGNVTVTDAADNSATFTSPAASIDKTRPIAVGTASPPPDSNGWNNTDVTVTFTGTDALSNVANCSPLVVLTTSGANQSASGWCVDRAGNVSLPVTVTGININKAGPAISGMPAASCYIWPPDGRLVQIAAITTSVPNATLSVNVTSNEPVAAGDIVVNGGVAQVRAVRAGNGSGRIYTVVARAADTGGNVTEARGTCTVPHHMNGWGH